MSGAFHRARENVTEIVSVLVTGIWLTALFTGQGWWLPVMLFGYVVVVPLTALLVGDREAIGEWWSDEDVSIPADSPEDDPIQTLRDRYARGELTEGEFERKLERLLETESIEDLDRHGQRTQDRLDRDLERE